MSNDESDPTCAMNYIMTLQRLKERQIEIDWEVRTLIKAAREEGITWRHLGEIMGTSGQAAWEKYRPRDMP